VIHDAMAQRFWGSKDPSGARVNLCSLAPQPCWFTIVGVVGNVHEYGLEKSTTFDVYSAGGWTPYIIMRTAADPTALAAAAAQEIHKIEPTLPVTDVRTLDSLLDDSVSTRKFSTVLLGSFAALALLLAAVGVYGVMNYAVSVRTSEIGLRVALGAQRHDVWRLVFGRAATLAVTGIVIGIAGTLGTSRYIAALLFAVKPADPLTLFGAALLLFAVAMVACYVPARRAMRVDPMVALRHE
jgi:ABC-type lipoprotein release transport system permease subunit